MNGMSGSNWFRVCLYFRTGFSIFSSTHEACFTTEQMSAHAGHSLLTFLVSLHNIGQWPWSLGALEHGCYSYLTCQYAIMSTMITLTHVV